MSLTADQKSQKLFKHYLGTSDSKEKREFFEEPINSSFTITPMQLWTYGDKIPRGDSARTVGIPSLDNNGIYTWQKSDSETIPIVKRFKDYSFSAIDAGTDNAFVLLDSNGKNMQQIIPFNFSEEIYNYSLKTKAGKKIPFGVGDWVFDTFSGAITFYGVVPQGVDHLNPPLFSFFQYVGDIGFRQDRLGLDGVVLPIEEIEIPSGTSTYSSPSLTNKILATADKVANDFVATYGWDGADNNEGIALSFEALVPIVYTATRDQVKGYDDSVSAEIESVISRIHAIETTHTYSDLPFNVTFINENAGIFLNSEKIKYKITASGLDFKLSKNDVSGVTVTFNDNAIILKDANEKVYVIVEKVKDLLDYTGTYEFTLERKNEAVLALLYWSSTKKQYWPFVTKESSTYNTGFPVAVANGKIPPSLAIGSIPLSGYSDIITPDYYGPRIFNIVIALENEHKVKSADYVVKNTDSYFLDDILSTIKTEYPNLEGTIYLRNGTYRVNKNTLDLSMFRNVEFIGEDKNKTIIAGPTDASSLTIQFTDDVNLTPCNFGLRNVSVKNATVILSSESGKTFSLVDVVGINSDLVVIKRSAPTMMIRNCLFDDVTISSADAITEETKVSLNFDSLTTFVYDNTFNTFTTNVRQSTIRGNYIKTASLNNGSIYFKENTVDTLANKVTGAIIQCCEINKYGATISKNEYPAKYEHGAIPIYGEMGYNYKKYVNLANPFYYEEFAADGSASDLIKIRLDDEVLEINSDGELTTCLTSDRINVGKLKFDKYALDDDLNESTRHTFEGGTLTEALNYLSEFKADLIAGKVPLRQLPDAVAYGGLLYKGSWCFETNAGTFPDNDDLAGDTSDEDLSKEDYIDTLQAGWFVIVIPSAEALAANDPARNQVAIDGTIYTAGDWCVWNGTKWEKLDRAYQDACYAILAAYDPDNNPWYWKKTGSTGWLDFSNITIYEAFSRINDLFTKLIPKRPSSINDDTISLVIKTNLNSYSIKQISDDGTLGKTKTAFNVNEKDAKRITIGVPESEERTGLIYYGDTSTVSAIIDNAVAGSVNMDYSINNVQIKDALVITKDFDPFKKKDFGEGFWKGFSADIKPIYDVDALGSHTYSLVVDKALPETVTKNTNGMKSKSYELFMPYVPTAFTIGDTSVTDFDPSLPNAKTMTNACSGIYKLPYNFNITLSTVLLKALYEYIKDDSEIVLIKNSIDNTYENISGFIVDKNDEGTSSDKYFDIVINNYTKNINADRIYENFKFTVKIKGILDNNIIETDIITISTRIDNVSEQERVTSGMSTLIYPVYNSNASNGLNQVGKAFVSSNSLKFGFYVSELMKIGRNRFNNDGSLKDVVYEYMWPQGDYYYLKNSHIDYSNTTGSLLDTSTFKSDEARDWMKKEIRWVTFEKFMDADSYKEIVLNNASGFLLNFNVADDKQSKFVIDDLSGSTKNILIYAKVLGLDPTTQTYLSDADGLNSGWIDCNLPYEGFTTPFNNGDPAMYAGSSTAISKRITFGKTTRSGKLIVRIGITKDSEVSFEGISIKEII